MEYAWALALIMLPVICIWLIVWWIPHCEKEGIEKARQREIRESQSTQGV
jgi:hypothetical protein